ncbi:flagellar export chaperone FliS [Paenibacillus protaetiae]|uniref:flagellar export chaperone FliS n=1 Tax=Paenibacillus protaetiae TaxID=2509456 RepID=UPI0031342DC9
MNSPLQRYQQASVQTANPGQLILMLYDGAIRFTKLGIEGITAGKYDMANTNLKKAQAIIHELTASLNHSYEISKDLAQIYEYWLHRLIEANLKKEVQPAVEILNHLADMRESWKQIIKGSAGAGQSPLEASSV